MIRVNLDGELLTIQELSELSGIAPATLRDRIRRGYSIDECLSITPTKDSVREFATASWYIDWIGMSTYDLHKIYWKWCISNKYTPVHIKVFTKQLMRLYPNLKTVPTRKKNGCYRVIRER